MRRKFNNKGSVLEVMSLLTFIIGTILALGIGLVVFVQFQGAMEEANLTTEYDAQINDTYAKMGTAFTTFDALFFPIAITGLIIGLIVTSFLIPSHPVFLVVNLIGIVFIVFLGIVFQSVYESFITMEYFNTTTSVLTYSQYTMSYLPWIGAIAITIATIVGFSKRTI
jgi:hypothetical protein